MLSTQFAFRLRGFRGLLRLIRAAVDRGLLLRGTRDTSKTPSLLEKVHALREVPSDSPWRPTINEET